MPTIQFDVLIPDAHDNAPEQLREAFELAVNLLVENNRLMSGVVSRSASAGIPDDIVDELREVYERERGEEPGDATMHRYDVDAHAEGISYNELAMSLSRILTPQADLPGDRVLEEQHEAFEVGSIYPWLVEIRR